MQTGDHGDQFNSRHSGDGHHGPQGASPVLRSRDRESLHKSVVRNVVPKKYQGETLNTMGRAHGGVGQHGPHHGQGAGRQGPPAQQYYDLEHPNIRRYQGDGPLREEMEVESESTNKTLSMKKKSGVITGDKKERETNSQ